MNIARTILPIALALSSAACAANTGPEDEEARTGEASEKLITQVTAGGYHAWHYTQFTSDYIDSLQVNGVLGHTFEASGAVDFVDFEGPGVPWTTANIQACESSYIYVSLTKLLNGSWVAWDTIGNINAKAFKTCDSNGCYIGTCYTGFSKAPTTFGSSTAFNVYMSYVSSDGVPGSGSGYINVYQDN